LGIIHKTMTSKDKTIKTQNWEDEQKGRHQKIDRDLT